MSEFQKSLYVLNDTNIKILPKISTFHTFDENAQISIGDLHGNALKLIYFLIKHGVFSNVSAQDYSLFFDLYSKDAKEITKQDLAWFNGFIEKIKVHTGGTIRLLGDELADRGSNDYFTLKIMGKLVDSKIPVEVVLSNHTIDFIKAYETRDDYAPNNLRPCFVKSMIGLNQIIDKKLVSKNEIDKLYEKIYFPNLKALTYTINEEKIQLRFFLMRQ